MSDKYTLQLKNFRSIRDAEIDIAPLTVVYGPNGSGKSSLIYGLLTLKNFLTNPNQNLPSLFSYPGLSLGGFDEVVFNHQGEETIEVSLSVSPLGWDTAEFTLEAANSGGKSAVFAKAPDHMEKDLHLLLEVPFPYHTNQSESGEVVLIWEDDDGRPVGTQLGIGWNGINLSVDSIGGKASQEIAVGFLEWANAPMKLSRETYFVPLRRGFMSPVYGVTNISPMLNTDTEVASMLATDRYLGYKVSDYMEMVSDRQLHARAQIGTSSFTLDSVPRNRGETPVSIVNEGFGVNQLAYLLTIALYDKARIVLIEEPEIHLHPSMVRKLVHALTDIALNNDKRFIISTHSETFVVALLAQIAKREIDVDDVSFLLAEKKDGESRFTKQEAKSNGQIQGGLDSFIAAELEDMAAFFEVAQKEENQ